MTEAEIDAALADLDTWMTDDATGPIMLMTADHLLGRWPAVFARMLAISRSDDEPRRSP